MNKTTAFAVAISVVAIFLLASFRQGENPKQKAHFNHFAIYVYDLKASTNFYQQILQLDTIPNPFNDGKHTWFNIGEHSQMHLIAGNVKEQIHPKDTHLCLSVGSTEEFMQQLKATKTNFSSWTGGSNVATLRADGVKQVYLQDPDGYWIEINDDKY